ncbi:MAG: hypothetical protein IJ859_05910 [Synergistaceae bacterium]|nr:hypothetical protein [Synergistaceae bacterium]
MSEMVTKNELDIHLKGIDDRISFNEHITDIRISAIKDAIDSHLAETRALIEKNAAEMRGDVEQLRADFNDLRGDVKALSAKVDSIQVKFGWYLALFTVLIFLAQKFFN